MADVDRILIVGGGIAGLSLATLYGAPPRGGTAPVLPVVDEDAPHPTAQEQFTSIALERFDEGVGQPLKAAPAVLRAARLSIPAASLAKWTPQGLGGWRSSTA